MSVKTQARTAESVVVGYVGGGENHRRKADSARSLAQRIVREHLNEGHTVDELLAAIRQSPRIRCRGGVCFSLDDA